MRGLQNRSGAAFDVCCSHHAPRALWEVMRYAFTTEPDLAFGQPLHRRDGRAHRRRAWSSPFPVSTAIERRDVRARHRPRRCRRRRRSRFASACRRGRARPSCSVNGQPVAACDEQPGFAAVEREWRDGDRLSVRFPHRVAVVRGHRLGEHVLHPDEAAVLFGPRVFCLSDLHNPAVQQHLVRLRRRIGGRSRDRRRGPDRLEATGVAPDGTVRR